jgi:NAD(P)-dependent dehydrogenase (short-subunit alcohol dehydrogenase family)
MNDLSKSDSLGLFGLKGRIALVTGAAGHIGRHIVSALCDGGAHVIMNGRNETHLEAERERVSRSGKSVSAIAGDITDDSFLDRLSKQIEKDFGRLDIVVNNAYSGKTNTLESATLADFENAFKIAVVSAFRIVQLTTGLLEKAAEASGGSASVINIATMYAVVSPNPAIYGNTRQNNPPDYGAAKAGLLQYTRYAACHLAPHKIRVNAISPGPFPAPRTIETMPEFICELNRKNPMGRVGTPDELRGAILFLASDASSYVTGVNIPVDGGWTAW